MKLKAYLTITVRDNPTDKVISKHRQQAHSHVRQIIDILYRHARRVSYPVTDYAGVPKDNTPGLDDWYIVNAAAGEPVGIIVGTGDTAVAISDYSLETMIADGSGAGELIYQNHSWTPPATAGSRRKFLLNRALNNQSGGTITVKEAGVRTYGQPPGSYFMILRDVLDAPEAIPHNTSAIFQYEFYVEV